MTALITKQSSEKGLWKPFNPLSVNTTLQHSEMQSSAQNTKSQDSEGKAPFIIIIICHQKESHRLNSWKEFGHWLKSNRRNHET